jgi:uncharacterized SAM-dependent methyltransferase
MLVAAGPVQPADPSEIAMAVARTAKRNARLINEHTDTSPKATADFPTSLQSNTANFVPSAVDVFQRRMCDSIKQSQYFLIGILLIRDDAIFSAACHNFSKRSARLTELNVTTSLIGGLQ